MLRLQSISLFQFKNYGQQNFQFSKKVIGICGNNGVGKTNLLDAIYYLCFTKSYFSSTDATAVMQGQQGFRLQGIFDINGEKADVTCILRENAKKEFSMDGEIYSRTSKHIGKLPCTIIAPDDVDLIIGGSEGRRKFLDAITCQINPDYLQQLIDYNKLLLQRNSLLKSFAERGKIDENLLQVLNQQIIPRGEYIFNERKVFLQQFLPRVSAHYQSIAQNNEPLQVQYQSQLLTENFSQLLQINKQRDLALQRTTTGIHRDDLMFLLHDVPFKQTASQGQRKSLLFALKLTEYETLEQQKNIAPILLLDDVFEKLDADRMQNLLQEVCIEKKGQVFITDTHRERLEKNLSAIGADFEIIEVS
jgi:DNA replication and repair protein RecF